MQAPLVLWIHLLIHRFLMKNHYMIFIASLAVQYHMVGLECDGEHYYSAAESPQAFLSSIYHTL
jgi:hypothetical protein